MSLRRKLEQAAVFAARDATLTERGRVLWILDELVRATKEKLTSTILVESEIHAARVKLLLAETLVGIVRRHIVSGVGPQPETNEQKAARIAKEIEEEDHG